MSKRKADLDKDDYGIRVPGDRLEILDTGEKSTKHTLDSDEDEDEFEQPSSTYDVSRMEGNFFPS
jgi:hypothetical protein